MGLAENGSWCCSQINHDLIDGTGTWANSSTLAPKLYVWITNVILWVNNLCSDAYALLNVGYPFLTEKLSGVDVNLIRRLLDWNNPRWLFIVEYSYMPLIEAVGKHVTCRGYKILFSPYWVQNISWKLGILVYICQWPSCHLCRF